MAFSRLLPQALEDLADSLSSLPGIGPKSAMRMAVYLLSKEKTLSERLQRNLTQALSSIQACSRCRNLTEGDLCSICANAGRDAQLLMIIETPSDLVQIEQSSIYNGKYFVLTDLISPINGVTPETLELEKLQQLVATESVTEVIFALSSTVEGEATAAYIENLLLQQTPDLKLTKLARGLPTGVSVEYLDKETLAGAFSGRK